MVFKEVNTHNKKINKELSENMQEILECFFNEVFDIKTVSSFVTLYLLSVITYPHFNYTRYPDLEVNPKEYAGLGITKSYLDIYKNVDECINNLDKYFKRVKELVYSD